MIDEIVAQAASEMDAVVVGFAVAAPTATSGAELDQMEAEASAALDQIHAGAMADLDAISDQSPATISEAAKARASLNKQRNDCRADLREIAASTSPSTSTTSTSTTSTTTTTTTTTIAQTTAVPLPTRTTPVPRSTAEASEPQPSTSPDDVGGEETSPEPPVDDQVLAPLSMFQDPGVPSEQPVRSEAVLSEGLADRMSVVMPPRLAVALVSPLIVFEALARVVFDSLEALVLPTLLLVGALLFMARWKPEDASAAVDR